MIVLSKTETKHLFSGGKWEVCQIFDVKELTTRQYHRPILPSASLTTPRIRLLLYETRQVSAAGGQLKGSARNVEWLRRPRWEPQRPSTRWRIPLGSYERATVGSQGGERGNRRAFPSLGNRQREHPRKTREEPLNPDECVGTTWRGEESPHDRAPQQVTTSSGKALEVERDRSGSSRKRAEALPFHWRVVMSLRWAGRKQI